jgi:RNA polymerase sigma-70 factor (sigma-E family)
VQRAEAADRKDAGMGEVLGDAKVGIDSDADYRDLFFGHFAAMTRLAAMLGADDPEDIAQEAFVRLHGRRGALRDPNSAAGYLRTTVVNLVRSRQRHLTVVRRHRSERPEDAASAEHAVVARENNRELVAAVQRLSPRHREAIVLRYWLDLSEREIAEAMGTSPGTVKSNVSRGLAALAEALGEKA